MNQTILNFFQGKSSMIRLCLLIATLCLWVPYAYSFIVTKQPPKLDPQVATAYGLLVGSKAAQTYVEKKYGATTTTSTTTPVTPSTPVTTVVTTTPAPPA
jgi:hypothetical protein